MKFSVSQSTLAKAIAVVSKGLASATNSAILAGILVRAEEGTVELQTTNQTIHVRDLMAANVSEPGETVVSGRMLANIVKALPDSAVTFETDGPQIGISCEHASFRMNTMDAADFPEFPTYALESSISLPVEVLREMEGRVGRATRAAPSSRGSSSRWTRATCASWPPTPSAWPSATRRSRARGSSAPSR